MISFSLKNKQTKKMTKINAWMHSLSEIPIPSIIPCCARGSFMTGESRTVGRRVTAIRVTDRCWGREGGAAAGSPLSLTDSPLSAWRVCELTHGTGVVYGWSVCQWNFVSPHPCLSHLRTDNKTTVTNKYTNTKTIGDNMLLGLPD